MVGRAAISVLSTLLFLVPNVACAGTPTSPTTPAPAPVTSTAPAPTPTPASAPSTTSPSTAIPTVGASQCPADPRTEAACLRRENEELRQRLNAMITSENERKERMAKQLGGGKAIEALR